MAIWNMSQMNCKDMQNIRFNVNCAVILFVLAENCLTLMVLHLVAGTVFLNIMQKTGRINCGFSHENTHCSSTS